VDFRGLQTRLLNEVRTRVKNGEMTERSLARLSGISQPHIHNVLKGTRLLSFEGSDRLLRRLQIELADLLLEAGAADGRPQPAEDPCRMVRLLTGRIGPGHPYPHVLGRERYAFPAEDVDGLGDPVAVRLAQRVDDGAPFGGSAVLLLDRAVGRTYEVTREGYFAVDLWGASAIGRMRPGQELAVWSEAGTWEPAGLGGAPAADLIRAKVKLVVFEL